MPSTKLPLPIFLDRLRRQLPALGLYAYFLFGFLRKPYSLRRASSGSHIKTLVAEGLKLLKPVLLTSSQQFRNKHQFQDFKGKSISAVFVPGMLQMGITMFVPPKSTKMLAPASTQMHSTAYVNFLVSSAGDFVNAR